MYDEKYQGSMDSKNEERKRTGQNAVLNKHRDQ